MSHLDRWLLRVVGGLLAVASLVYLGGHVSDWYLWRRDTITTMKTVIDAGVRLERQVSALDGAMKRLQETGRPVPSLSEPVKPGKGK